MTFLCHIARAKCQASPSTVDFMQTAVHSFARPNRAPHLAARICAALLAAAALLLTPALALAQACENPKVLRYSIIPTQESIRELTLYKPVIDLLAKNTG